MAAVSPLIGLLEGAGIEIIPMPESFLLRRGSFLDAVKVLTENNVKILGVETYDRARLLRNDDMIDLSGATVSSVCSALERYFGNISLDVQYFEIITE